MKKKSVMQEDFEKFLKSLPKKVFVNTESDNGDWWYSFAFSENIYLALYSHQTDEFVRIQRVAGKEEAFFLYVAALNWANGDEFTQILGDNEEEGVNLVLEAKKMIGVIK